MKKKILNGFVHAHLKIIVEGISFLKIKYSDLLADFMI